MGTPTDVFAVTAADLKARLNPLDDPQLFDYGTGTSIAESGVDVINARSEQKVLSALPEKYRKLCREVEGEIVVPNAFAGQTIFGVSLFPVLAVDDPRVGDEPLALYVDFGRQSSYQQGNQWLNETRAQWQFPMGVVGSRPYSDRRRPDLLDPAKYDFAADTGVITLHADSALTSGQLVHADYRHTAAPKIELLRDMILELSAVQVQLSFPSFARADVDVLRFLEQRVIETASSFYAAKDRVSGIDVFDRIKLEYETRMDRPKLRMPLLGGM